MSPKLIFLLMVLIIIGLLILSRILSKKSAVSLEFERGYLDAIKNGNLDKAMNLGIEYWSNNGKTESEARKIIEDDINKFQQLKS